MVDNGVVYIFLRNANKRIHKFCLCIFSNLFLTGTLILMMKYVRGNIFYEQLAKLQTK